VNLAQECSTRLTMTLKALEDGSLPRGEPREGFVGLALKRNIVGCQHGLLRITGQTRL
jgi:hypothetical protein